MGTIDAGRGRSAEVGCSYRLDYFKRRHCDAVTLSAGGIVAFYPPKARRCTTAARSSAIATVGDLCRGCQKLGMVPVAQVEPA